MKLLDCFAHRLKFGPKIRIWRFPLQTEFKLDKCFRLKLLTLDIRFQLMKKVILFLVLVVLIMTSCQSSKGFTKRKYTPGHYVSLPSRRHAPNERVPGPKTPAALSQKPQQLGAPEELMASAGHSPVQSSTDIHEQKNSRSSMPDLTRPLKSQKSPGQPLFKKYKPLPILEKQKSGSATRAPGDNSQAGVVLAGIGLVLDVIGLVVAGATLEYFFLLFTLAGVALGAIALIFGLKGLSLYKKEKRSGNKHTTTLVFSIISTALGGGAIILGLLYSLFGLIIVSF